MSVAISAMVWKVRGLGSTEKLVLARLADFADDDGARVYPSVPRVAEDCGLSDRGVQLAIKKLVVAGFLIRVAEANPATKRACEYRINTTIMTGEPCSPPNDVHPRTTFTGESPSPLPPNDVHPRGEPRSPITTIYPPVYPSDSFELRSADEEPKPKANRPPSSSSDIDADFAEWYAAYPRRVGRGHALKAYRAARRKTDAETLLNGAKRFAERRAAEDPNFTPHPSTWLNGGRWDDDDTKPASPAPSAKPRPQAENWGI